MKCEKCNKRCILKKEKILIKGIQVESSFYECEYCKNKFLTPKQMIEFAKKYEEELE